MKKRFIQYAIVSAFILTSQICLSMENKTTTNSQLHNGNQENQPRFNYQSNIPQRGQQNATQKQSHENQPPRCETMSRQALECCQATTVVMCFPCIALGVGCKILCNLDKFSIYR